MPADTIQIDMGQEGRAEAYLSRPEGSGPWPGLVVLPEIYNANHWVREVADGYAAQGYLALAPDIYWRQSPGQYLPYTPEGQATGRALGYAMDLDAFTGDMGRYVGALTGASGCNGRVGTVGFCLGGKLAYLAATRGLVDAAVGYYAVQLDKHLDEAARLARPLLLHFAELDAHVPPDVVSQVEQALAARPDVEIHRYAGADHGFNRFGYPPFHEASAKLALERTLGFLGRHLR
ncbi:MAG: dienelactone hydrolase family protein [Gammaproteobacteria bacterium]|nr:dienelactone hydrolase family protein [Gammaproteobacteria bacterium]